MSNNRRIGKGEWNKEGNGMDLSSRRMRLDKKSSPILRGAVSLNPSNLSNTHKHLDLL